MTHKFDKVLTENLNLPEDIKTQLVEAWDEQLSEAREDIAAEMRQEFSQKFTHDKKNIVEAMNNFLEEKVRAELTEFAEDKKQLAEERVAYKKKLKVFESFLAQGLAKEVKELREDRKSAQAGFEKLEAFVIEQLSEEIKDLHADKKALVEQRVKLVREGKIAIAEAKKSFITKSATLVESNIKSMLKTEITQYREDIERARQNEFGRQVFEAFGGEFMSSFLNENTEVKKLQNKLNVMESTVEKLNGAIAEKDQLVESANIKLKATQDRAQRGKVMGGLLKTLSEDKKTVMKGLLESVSTDKLESEFRKYLPAVLNESAGKKSESNSGKVLNESTTIIAGNRAVAQPNSNDTELAEILTLAGLKK